MGTRLALVQLLQEPASLVSLACRPFTVGVWPSGAAEACWAHNPEVDGLKPSPATCPSFPGQLPTDPSLSPFPFPIRVCRAQQHRFHGVMVSTLD